MSDRNPLLPSSPAEFLNDGTYGAFSGKPGVQLTRREDFSFAFLSVSHSHRSDFDRAARVSFGGDLPTGSKSISFEGITFVGTGVGRWLVSFPGEADLEARLQRSFGDVASITDQSHGYVVFDLAGASLRGALSKGILIDTDPSVFGDGAAATTTIAHINSTFWVLNGASLFRFAVPRSFAPAFMRFIVSSALEFGIEVRSEAETDA